MIATGSFATFGVRLADMRSQLVLLAHHASKPTIEPSSTLNMNRWAAIGLLNRIDRVSRPHCNSRILQCKQV